MNVEYKSLVSVEVHDFYLFIRDFNCDTQLPLKKEIENLVFFFLRSILLLYYFMLLEYFNYFNFST